MYSTYCLKYGFSSTGSRVLSIRALEMVKVSDAFESMLARTA